MKKKKTIEFEFDFEANAKDAIRERLTAFEKLCTRYPNDADLGKKVRELTNESKVKLSDFLKGFMLASAVILSIGALYGASLHRVNKEPIKK